MRSHCLNPILVASAWDFHRLNPNSSTAGIRNPPRSTAQSILWSSLIRSLYIDPIIYNEENNALLQQADDYRAEINMLNKNISGDASHLRAATSLLHFAGKNTMLDSFDEELFEQTVPRIHQGR